jgi:RNA polymerase sigma-70 factor (ECF subfamily)
MIKHKKAFDGLLVLQCQNGDKKAFSLLVKRWHIKLCEQAFWYVKDLDIAKDIAQDCWTIILKRIYNLQEPNSFGSWALTIVYRKSIDWLRKEKNVDKKLHDYYEDSKTNYDTVENNTIISNDTIFTHNDTINVIMNAIKDLPQNQQIILRLFYLEECSINEIASILKITTGTVKSRLFYAREKLKSILKT